MGKHDLEGLMGVNARGVVYGLDAPVPGSGLTLTYAEGIVRVGTQTGTIGGGGKGYAEKRVAGSTQLFVASKDTYAYIDSAGAFQISAVTLGASIPSLDADGIGVDSELLYKVVTDGSDITSVVDLRTRAGIKLRTQQFIVQAIVVGHGVFEFTPGFHGRVIALHAIVSLAIGATAAATATPKIVDNEGTAVAITNAATSLAGGAAAGVEDLEIASAENIFGPFERIQITTAKGTTEGGSFALNVVMEEY